MTCLTRNFSIKDCAGAALRRIMQSVNGMLELFMKTVNSQLGCQENVASGREFICQSSNFFFSYSFANSSIFSNFPFG